MGYGQNMFLGDKCVCPQLGGSSCLGGEKRMGLKSIVGISHSLTLKSSSLVGDGMAGHRHSAPVCSGLRQREMQGLGRQALGSGKTAGSHRGGATGAGF